jgi:uncharacterized protein with WD repeat
VERDRSFNFRETVVGEHGRLSNDGKVLLACIGKINHKKTKIKTMSIPTNSRVDSINLFKITSFSYDVI